MKSTKTARMLLIAATLLPATAWAQTTEPPAPGAVPPSVTQRTTMVPQRISTYLGRDVYNAAEKNVGKVIDVVIDGEANRVSYALISHVGAADSAERFLAVPWGAIAYRQDEPKKAFVKLDEAAFTKAPGFAKDHFPDLGQPEYRRQLALYYQLTPEGEPGSAKPVPSTAPSKQGAWTRRATDLLGATVKNGEGETLGELRELIVDTSAARVQYAVLAYTTPGAGDKLFAVPLAAFQPKPDGKQLLLNFPRLRFKNSPGFNNNSWPDWASQEFRDSVDELYRPVAGTP